MENTSKTLIIFIVLLGVLGGMYFQLAYAPASSQIQMLETQVSHLQIRLTENRLIAENIGFFRKEVEKKCGTLERTPMPTLPHLPEALLAPLPKFKPSFLRWDLLKERKEFLIQRARELQTQIQAYYGAIREVDRLKQISRSCKK